MRILLAIDGSDPSIHARDLVASLPWPPGTAITLLTAYEVPIAWVGGGAVGGDWLTAAEAELRAQLTAELAEHARPLEGHGWTIDHRVLDARPASAIREVAAEIDADLVVLGSRGHGPMRTMLLGSVSAEVADQPERSVLVARSERVTRLLVATDGSECSAAIPDLLAGWQAFRGLPATALSVAPVDSPGYELLVALYTLGNAPLHAQRDELIAAHRVHAEGLARRLVQAGIGAEPEVRSGDAAHEIVAASLEHGADLIVTGSRCLHGVERWVLGSTARNVLQHAPASVLVLRAGRGDAIG